MLYAIFIAVKNREERMAFSGPLFNNMVAAFLVNAAWMTTLASFITYTKVKEDLMDGIKGKAGTYGLEKYQYGNILPWYISAIVFLPATSIIINWLNNTNMMEYLYNLTNKTIVKNLIESGLIFAVSAPLAIFQRVLLPNTDHIRDFEKEKERYKREGINTENTIYNSSIDSARHTALPITLFLFANALNHFLYKTVSQYINSFSFSTQLNILSKCAFGGVLKLLSYSASIIYRYCNDKDDVDNGIGFVYLLQFVIGTVRTALMETLINKTLADYHTISILLMSFFDSLSYAAITELYITLDNQAIIQNKYNVSLFLSRYYNTTLLNPSLDDKGFSI